VRRQVPRETHDKQAGHRQIARRESAADASPDGDCSFPTLFKSRSERVVRLIENPPQLRQQGFEIWADKTSEIILGRMRRNVLAGSRLIELWKDGLFIFIGPGDEDFLGWRMGGGDRAIHISNFVLAEAIHRSRSSKPYATKIRIWLPRYDSLFEEEPSGSRQPLNIS